MTIHITCPGPQCHRTLELKDRLAGKRVKCPGCGLQLSIPGTGVNSEVPSNQTSNSHVPPSFPSGSALLTHSAQRWRIPATALLSVALFGSILVGGWFFLKLGAIQSRLADATQTLSALKVEEQDAKKEIEALLKQIAGEEQKVHEAVTQKTLMQIRLADADQQATEGNNERVALVRQVEELTSKVDQLQARLTALDTPKPKDLVATESNETDTWKVIEGFLGTSIGSLNFQDGYFVKLGITFDPDVKNIEKISEDDWEIQDPKKANREFVFKAFVKSEGREDVYYLGFGTFAINKTDLEGLRIRLKGTTNWMPLKNITKWKPLE